MWGPAGLEELFQTHTNAVGPICRGHDPPPNPSSQISLPPSLHSVRYLCVVFQLVHVSVCLCVCATANTFVPDVPDKHPIKPSETISNLHDKTTAAQC